jgi:TolB-like protein/tetratricopeptide (TPR) repeat protein
VVTAPLARLSAALSDRYRLERELGHGGMATVYLAEDLKHQRRVAIKVLKPELAAVLGPERFLREITITAQLDHPHILPLLDSGQAQAAHPEPEAGGQRAGGEGPQSFLYYVMPLIEGESLGDRLAREKQLPLEEALQITREVADALGYAHERRVIHRDIKPDNILLSGGHARVADFGIARALDAAGGEKLTKTGLAVGTPAYMSPEQSVGQSDLDGRSDLYSLGCVLYEMLAGEPPYTGPTAQAIIAKRMTHPVPSVRSLRETVPESVDRALTSALAKAPVDRYATAHDFAEALASEGTARPPARSRTWWVLVGIPAAAVLAILAWQRWPHRSAVPHSAQVIAVLPFTPSGADTALARLGRDLVFTVSAALEGVGEIHTVDPHTVLAQGDAPMAGYSLAQGRSLAGRFGAGSLVQGSLVRDGDKVRLDLSLFPTDSGPALAVASVTSHPDSLAALTDSITHTLLRQIWQRGTPPTPSLEGALQTRSAPALRAFLEGEQRLSENRWIAAADGYARAIAADSTFWLAYWRHAYALGWYSGEVPPKEVELYRRHRFQLPEADRLMIEVSMVQFDSLGAGLALSRRATQRFPYNWLAWFDYGDNLVHWGPLLGHGPDETRAVLRRALNLNPRLLPAWEHLMCVDLLAFDTADVAAVLDTLEKLNAGPMLREGPGGQDEMLELRFLSRLERGQAVAPAFFDSVAREVAGHGWVLLLHPGFWGYGFGRAEIEIDRRALALAGEPGQAALVRRDLGRLWAARGAWDSALAATDRYAQTSEGTDSKAPLGAYRLAVLAAWVGAVAPAEANHRRVAASRSLVDLGVGQRAEMLWLDGLLAFTGQNRPALASAHAALDRMQDPGARVAARTLGAMDLALTGSMVRAAESLAALQREQTERTYQDIQLLPSLLPVGRMLAARWLTMAGDTAQALRLLAWNDAFFFHLGSAFTSILSGPVSLERARLEEARGQTEAARAHYEHFLRLYDLPVPAQRHLVEEARAALRRLSGRRDRPEPG